VNRGGKAAVRKIPPLWRIGLVVLALNQGTPARASQGDLFRFFAEEAQIVTAGRLPRTLLQVPATVYVIPGAAVQTAGGQRLWEVLRRVPGVEVMTPRAYQGEVSIRGLGKPLSNRTLVLLDGRTVLNSFFDFVLWEAIPVLPDEIDRVEIVEGPSSALYGANALNGVINIITKAPAKMHGGQVQVGAGQGRSRSASALWVGNADRVSYRLAASWRRAGQFEHPDRLATRVAGVRGQVDWDPDPRTHLSLGAGVDRTRNQLTSGATGTTDPSFTAGYVRLDATNRWVELGGFWNWGSGRFDQFGLLMDPSVEYGTGELSAQRRFALPAGNLLVAGASVRRLDMRAGTFAHRSVDQSIWSLYFEDEWRIRPRLSVVSSGRLDRHELAGAAFSPRLAAVYTPWPGQVFRVAIATAFRYPNLNENLLDLEQQLPVPRFLPPDAGFTGMSVSIRGNPDLRQERIRLAEVAHRGRFGALETTLAGYHYRLRDIIVLQSHLAEIAPPVFQVENAFANLGEARAWGLEAGAEWRCRPWLSLAANYSFLRLRGAGDPLAARRGSPAHKGNAGVDLRRGRLTAELWAHYVGPTWWAQNLSGFPVPDGKVDAYLLAEAGARYELGGPLGGTELGIGVFNLLDDRHYQILPSAGPDAPGQYGERLGRRVTCSVSRRF